MGRALSYRATVFPAHAGMARENKRLAHTEKAFSPHTRGWPGCSRHGDGSPEGFPRTRGDGPTIFEAQSFEEAVFPAHAGMARLQARRKQPTSFVFPAHAGMARRCR